MRVCIRNVSTNILFFCTDPTDHISGKTGLTGWTKTRSKDGGAFGSAHASTVVTELSYGWYKLAVNLNDVDTLGELAWHLSATGGDPVDFKVIVQDNLGVGESVKRGQALAGFPFVLVDSTDHRTPITGRTVSSYISKDAGSFTSTTNAVVEMSSGLYAISLTATEMDAKTIVLRFVATGADDRIITIVTSD